HAEVPRRGGGAHHEAVRAPDEGGEAEGDGGGGGEELHAKSRPRRDRGRGFAALVWGADRFVMGAAATARNLGVSPLIIGLTIVGFGTSAPEMLVSSVAAWEGAANLSVGNAIGSNITNVALVLGVASLVSPLQVPQHVLSRELPTMIGVMLFAGFLLFDRTLDRVDGTILLTGMVLMVALVVRDGLRKRDAPDEGDEIPSGMSTGVALLWLLVGLAVLLVSSRGLVWGATTVARHFGVSELVIGLTIVAFGTSLPELAATVVAAKKNEHEIAVGNVIGSNLFNTLGVLGLPGIIRPGPVEESVLTRDFPVMIGVGVLLFVLPRMLRPYQRITRWEGGVLLAVFVGWLSWIYLETTGVV
ncbi:MAG: calcium/sodium antiporter, partial [Myxococcota bacterium]